MKKIITILLSVMVVFCFTALPVLATNDSSDEYVPRFKNVADYADVLTDQEEMQLYSQIKEIGKEYEMDIVILTTMGVSPYERMELADDYFDYNGFGYGSSRDGALLLVNVNRDKSYNEGNSWVSTSGSAIDYVNDEDISSIGERLTPYLLLGNYYTAFESFQDAVKGEIDAEKTAKAILVAVITLLVAFASAFVYTKILKNQLKTVADAYEASDYVVDDSLNITDQYDHFLFSNVVRVKIEKNEGGSSTHTSSSGNTHGGGGF